MKRRIHMVLIAGVLAGGLIHPVTSEAGVDLNITIPLPGLGIAAPPALIVVPGSYAYFAPDVEADLFFYHGYWYRPYQGGWYYSVEYNGPWGRVAIGKLPSPLINLPPEYRDVPPGYERIPYHEVQRNWRRWEEERRWDEHDGGHGRHGHGMGMGHMGG